VDESSHTTCDETSIALQSSKFGAFFVDAPPEMAKNGNARFAAKAASDTELIFQ
jgi:hypothetical protein